jgi:hypothetical protein
VLLSYTGHFRGAVEDRDKTWIQAGTAAYVAPEEDGLEACAETLWTGGGVCAFCSEGLGGTLGVVPPEEIHKGIRFRHRVLCCGGECAIVMHVQS